jgi:hypothetical protein
MIFFGEDSLRNAIGEFVAHYHMERNHQGLGNRLIVPMETTGDDWSCRAASAAGWTAELPLP